MNKDTIIGFVLIALVLIGFSWYNQPSQEEIEAARKQDSIATVTQQDAAKKQKAEEAARKAQADAAAQGDTTHWLKQLSRVSRTWKMAWT